MSFDHVEAAIRLEGLSPTEKLVLICVAQPACQACSIAWPGVPRLMRDTGLGDRAIRSALEALVRGQRLEIYRYPKGGRGRATEYIVLPGFKELSPNQCETHGKTLHHVQGIDPGAGDTLHHVQGIEGNPASDDTKTLHHVPPNQSINPISHARARDVEPAAPASSDPHPPLSRAENARRARELANALGDGNRLPSPPAVKDGSLEAS